MNKRMSTRINTPYTTPSGVQIGLLYAQTPPNNDDSRDAVRLQRALLSPNTKRTCDELGVCQARVPACQGCAYKPKDSWEALCHWLVRRFG
jgi:hypothetical protein